MKQSYLTFDYDNFNATGLKQVIAAFGRQKLPVLKDDSGKPKVEATNKQKRVRGYPTKAATLFFQDGQNVTLLVKPDGAIYQVKVNNRIVPITHTDNLTAAVKEVAGMLKTNAPAFTKKLEQQAKKHANDSDKTGKKRVSNAIPARLKAVNSQIANAEEELYAAQSSAAKAQQVASAASVRYADLDSDYQQEVARNEALSAELTELQAA